MKIEIGDVAFSGMEAKAEGAARLLAILANAKRLLALCHLLHAEQPVARLAGLVGLSPTALSQHLARMRDLGLVATRREGQTIFYRLASPEVAVILETLYGLYCTPPDSDSASAAPRITSATGTTDGETAISGGANVTFLTA